MSVVIRDMRPISIVGGHGFRELMRNIEPNYMILPTRSSSDERIEVQLDEQIECD
jgi:hypothetical protein